MNIKRLANELITALNWCRDYDLVEEVIDHVNSGIEFDKEEVDMDD